jgi:DNA polymerase
MSPKEKLPRRRNGKEERMTKLFLDFETRSELDIKRCGAWKYAQHPSTEVLCLGAGDSQGVDVFKNFKGIPAHLFGESTVFVAHNAHFEYAIWNYILHKRYGWPALWSPSRWSCTLSRAAAANLPLSLDGACKALNVKHQKDVIKGRQAMHKLCKPSGYDIFNEPIWNNDPTVLQTLYEYCASDVRAEMDLDARLPELSAEERKVWELDLRINHRGILADTEAAEKAVGWADKITTELNKKLFLLTGGAVEKATRIAGIKAWLLSKGIKVDSLDKESVTNLLKDTKIAQDIKDVISIRQRVGKSSTAKYQAILDAAGANNRIRGTLQYHAAGTGRWGGRLVQPQNLPKGSVKDVEAAIASLSSPDFASRYDNPMEVLSSCIRGVMCVAPEGRDLVVADYSAIEARVLLWLAGDELALGKYRMGINLYVDMARSLFNNSEIKKDTHPKEYAIGKAIILGSGYGMGKDKFKGTCDSWGIEGVTIELAEEAIRAYRKKYRAVVEMWYAVEKAAHNAIVNKGSVHKSCGGRVSWQCDREFLICTLPSGRQLRYFRPSIKPIDTPYGEKQEIHYWAAGLNGSLEEQKTYGGSLVENNTQATARDIMANGMLNVEKIGYTTILTVHDEVVAEVVEGKGCVKSFVEWLCATPPWAEGCPIEAEGWIGKRYRK